MGCSLAQCWGRRTGQGWAALWGLAGARTEQGSPLVDEGVEAGEDKEGHHGAESHEVVKHRLQVGGCDGGLTGLVPDVAHLFRVHKAADEILQSKEPGGAEILRALPRPSLFFIQTHAHPSCCLSITRHTQVTHACGPLHAVPCCHIYTMVPRHDRGQ